MAAKAKLMFHIEDLHLGSCFYSEKNAGYFIILSMYGGAAECMSTSGRLIIFPSSAKVEVIRENVFLSLEQWTPPKFEESMVTS